jgi:opacity protein-like surface antigen
MKRLAAVAVLAALLAVPAARADGDPASDYLLGQQVFFPYDLKVSSETQQSLVALVNEANSKGYTIRVAMIWSSYDLGSVPGLWRKPQDYARFLGAELRYVYKNRLLIVMPNGFGFYHQKKPTTEEYATLGKITVAAGANGFVDATREAVTQLAADNGVKLTGATAPRGTSKNHDRLVIVLGATAALLVAIGLRLVLRRRGAKAA